MQGVTAVVKELCTRFPMVDYHNGGMLLAVGLAPVTEGRGRSEGSRPGFGMSGTDAHGGPVTVYDMSTGCKTRALHFRYHPQAHSRPSPAYHPPPLDSW